MNEKFFDLPAAKQAAILNGAIKQFAEMGYRKASTGDIARESGISKALLFHYFGSKKELFAYVYGYSFDLVIKSLSAFNYKENEDLFEMIRRSNLIKLEVFKTYPYLYKFAYSSYFEEDAEVQDIVKKKNTSRITESTPDVIKYMDKSKLKEGIPPDKALRIILWVSEGFLQEKLNAKDYDPDKLFTEYDELMDILKLCLYEH